MNHKTNQKIVILAALFASLPVHAALNQTVNFSVQDSGYALSGAGGAGVYTTGTSGIVALTTSPSTFSAAPTGFSGQYLAVENLTNVNSSVYTDNVAYVNLSAAYGTATAGSFTFSFKMAAPNAVTDRYDSSTSITGGPTAYAKLEYRVDGGLWLTALNVEGRGFIANAASPSPANIGMWWDSNFDGLLTDADTQITSGAASISRTITGINVLSSFETRLSFRSKTQEEMAFDDIGVSSAAFTAVPEPSTYGLAGAGTLGLVAMLRRRRRFAGK